MKVLRALGRMIGAIGLMLGLSLAHAAARPFMADKKAMPRLMHRKLCDLFNLTIKYQGAPDDRRQKIVVANHLSSLDGFVVGSRFDGAFVAMADIVRWPVVGPLASWLGKGLGTMFIERTKAYLPRAHYKIVRTLNRGESIIFFPESHTKNGKSRDVGQFKAGLFKVLFNEAVDRDNKPLNVDRPLPIQPVAIRVLEVAGKDATTDNDAQAVYCWGDTYGLKHFWNILSCPGMTLEVTALPPLDPKDFGNRLDLANTAQKMVRDAVLGIG
ncbi:MAG: 1-acyl-sn-glycerol-3-phosphate acyltransferase [Micavibrio aeruginosavorus]|uniref:1-acyl-sn-glycerol-3-phosphate acyltransferase n=1 Tax=Micavibrio aeruginosavorus TaxID=349221 RepID=A0A7T5R0F8_9BACT|nr:MAG: 1-acyl-sn-glycerol-3-phosphate acyltransferase [Micavibrio aeruginosavorus]